MSVPQIHKTTMSDHALLQRSLAIRLQHIQQHIRVHCLLLRARSSAVVVVEKLLLAVSLRRNQSTIETTWEPDSGVTTVVCHPDGSEIRVFSDGARTKSVSSHPTPVRQHVQTTVWSSHLHLKLALRNNHP